MKEYWLLISLLAVLHFAETDDLASALVCDEAALNSEGNSSLVVKLGRFCSSVVFSNTNVFSISDCVVSGQSNISFVDDGMR